MSYSHHKPVFFLTFANEGEPYLEQLKKESDAIHKYLMDYKQKGLIDVEREESATIQDLSYYLQRYKNSISLFHYGGHASVDNLHLEDGVTHVNGLAGLLSEQKNLNLVFLNGCATVTQANKLIDNGVKAVIATSFPVIDGRAAHFASLFYRGLSLGQTIRQAFQHAENTMKTKYQAYNNAEDTETIVTRGPALVRMKPLLPWMLIVNPAHEDVLDWSIPVGLSSIADDDAPNFLLMYDFEDKQQVEVLKKFLHILKRSSRMNLIDMHETDYTYSKNEAIQMGVERSDFILCCITYRFMGETYDLAVRAKNMGKRIIPILFNEVYLQGTLFEDLRMLPSDNKPIAAWPNADAAFTDITRHLGRLIEKL